MMIDEKQMEEIVARVLRDMRSDNPIPGIVANGEDGIFADINQAVVAAKKAQKELVALGLNKRQKLIDEIRKASIDNVEQIARLANEETGYGRVPDKIAKKMGAATLTPGIEDIKVDAKTGDDGLVLIEHVPYGVIASIEPATHPGSCIINHAISMIAAGNSIIILPHPKGVKTAQLLVRIYNRAIVDAGGPENLIVIGKEFSNEIFDKVITHPDVNLIVATGGPFVVEKAMKSGKKAIAAGPGNPPCVVDETVNDMEHAAKCIVAGASFDNTVLCIAEKTIIVVDSVADSLLTNMQKNGAYLVTDGSQKERLMETIFPNGKMAGDLVGKNASVILKRIGIDATDELRLIIMEVPASHPLVFKEQLMPVVPVVRVKNFEEAVDLAEASEQGFKHTAVIHSSDVKRITRYANRLKVDIMVANASSGAGLAMGGEGHFSHTIASPTGEGICTPKTYTREQRTVIAGALYTA
jgi:NAD-dependent aldehyde dehydrogenases